MGGDETLKIIRVIATIGIIVLFIASLGCMGGGSEGKTGTGTTSLVPEGHPTTPETTVSSTTQFPTPTWWPSNQKQNVTVIFIVSVQDYTPKNASVYITGDFNGWNPGDEKFKLKRLPDGRWAINLTFPYGTVISFKFTRGSWETVESGPFGEDVPSRHFAFRKSGTYEFRVYNWHDHAENVTHTITGNVKTFKMFSPQLNRTVRIWVYLPPDYNSTKKRYPVLYMLDGQNLFDEATSFAGEWHFDKALRELYNRSGFSIIVVGIDNGGERRIDEYAPWRNERYGKGGEGNETVSFIVETLKSYIDALYRTRPDETGIMGSSLGGLLVIYAGFAHPNTFRYVSAISSAFWFNPQIYDFVRNATNGPEKIYIYWGTDGGSNPQEIVKTNRRMVEILKEKGYIEGKNLMVVEEQDGKHNEYYWAKHFPGAVIWLFGEDGE